MCYHHWNSQKHLDESDNDLDMVESAKKFLNLIVDEQEEVLNRMDMNMVICYNCNRKGHFVSDCRYSRATLENKNKKFSGRASSTIRWKDQGLFSTRDNNSSREADETYSSESDNS